MSNYALRGALIISMSLMMSDIAGAGSRWSKVPTVKYVLNNKQDAISFSDERNGWYGNGTGTIYGTTDGGRVWTALWSHRGTYIRAFEFANEKLGSLGNVGPDYFPNVSDRQPLYVTQDGGKSWDPITLVSGRQIGGVCAIDVLMSNGKVAAVRAGGRVGGPAGMLESFDEGQTFHVRDMTSVTGMILDIHFVDERTGFMAGASEAEEDKAHAKILKTTDGGSSSSVCFANAWPQACRSSW